VDLLHVLVVVGDDGGQQDVEHAQAGHDDHHQVEDVEGGQSEVVIFLDLVIKAQDIVVFVETSEEHDETGLNAGEKALKARIIFLFLVLFDHPETKGEAEEKNEGDHQVGPELLQDDMEHGGEVADGGEAVSPMLEDEAEAGTSESGFLKFEK